MAEILKAIQPSMCVFEIYFWFVARITVLFKALRDTAVLHSINRQRPRALRRDISSAATTSSDGINDNGGARRPMLMLQGQ